MTEICQTTICNTHHSLFSRAHEPIKKERKTFDREVSRLLTSLKTIVYISKTNHYYLQFALKISCFSKQSGKFKLG